MPQSAIVITIANAEPQANLSIQSPVATMAVIDVSGLFPWMAASCGVPVLGLPILIGPRRA
jgi:hypothetical protein